MKKFITWALACLFLIITLIAPVLPSTKANAESVTPDITPSTADTTTAFTVGGYACILNDTTYFYPNKNDDNGLFVLPRTYFVKILEPGDVYTKIEYLYDDEYTKKIIGYAKTDQLTPVDYTPRRPYFYQLFNVRYRLDFSFSGDDFLDEIIVTCAYYGDYTVGSKTYCYVLQNGTFGYVPKPYNFTFEENPEYEENLAPPTNALPEDNTQNKPADTNPAQIAILIALCLLVPILAALILRPQRRPPYENEP